MESLSGYFPWVFREKVSLLLVLGDFAHAHIDISIRSSYHPFLVLITFKEELYELIEDGPKPAENEEKAAKIVTGENEEKQM